MLKELEILKELDYKEEEGSLWIGGIRVFLPAVDILDVTRRKINGLGPAGKRFMYEAGKESGRRYADAVNKIHGKVEARDNFVELSEKFGSLTGWGKLEVVEKDYENQQFTVHLRNSLFTTEKKERTCEYNAGMLAGAAEVILQREMDVKEISCVNETEENKKCVFEMKPSEEFEILFPADKSLD